MIETSHILTMPEMATQLPNLLKQAKEAQHPLWLTTAENTAPVAVVMEVDEYERVQKRASRLYDWQLIHLVRWLDRIERQWDNELLKEECVQVWQEDTWFLWEVAPSSVRKFIAVLTQSAKKLNPKTFTKGQVAALRYSLEVAKNINPDASRIENAYQQLIESGISPRLAFDKEFVQLYLDEL